MNRARPIWYAVKDSGIEITHELNIDRVPVLPVKVVARVLILVGSSYWYMGTVYCSLDVRKPAVIKPSI